VLKFSDGEHPLLDIAEGSGPLFSVINAAADTLCDSGLLINTSQAQHQN